MKTRYTDEQLIEGLRRRNSSCIEHLYEEYFPAVRHFIQQNSGNHQDMEDLFQDTLMAVYLRCREDGFRLTSSLKTYFISVSKNLWLTHLERRHRVVYCTDCEVHEERPGYYAVDHQPRSEREMEMYRLFNKNLAQLPVDCRRILELYCLRVPYRQIAAMLGYSDEVRVKVRKYACKMMLRKRIMRDPECQPYIDHV
jgi:RNA polymerase sigma factor (sigma-70 family)